MYARARTLQHRPHRSGPMPAPKVGLFLITVHFAIYYWVPYFYGLFTGFHLLDFLNGSPSYHPAFLFSVVFYAAFVALYQMLPRSRPRPRRKAGFRLYQLDMLNLAAAVLFVLLSIRFATSYGLKFRQTGPALADTGPEVLILLTLQVYFSIYVVFHLALLMKGIAIKPIQRLIYLMCAAAYLLSLTSSFTTAIIALFLLLLAPKQVQKLLLLSGPGAKSFFQGFYLVIPLLLLVIAIHFVGTADKLGINTAVSQLFDAGYWGHMLDTIAYRVSIFFYSLAYHLTYTSDHTANALDSLRILLDSNQYRLSQVLGFGGYKPDVTSINRLNNLAIFPTQNDRTGSSPGLLASAFYTPIYPISILFVLLFMVWIGRMIDQILEGRSHLSMFGALLVLMSVATVWDAPINNLILLNPPFLKLLFLYLCWLNVRQMAVAQPVATVPKWRVAGQQPFAAARGPYRGPAPAAPRREP